MIQTVTVDIMNEKVLKLLQDLEYLQLIRLRKEEKPEATINRALTHKGAMTKQLLADVDNQLNDLRHGWE